MAPGCFGKTMPSSGSDYVPFIPACYKARRYVGSVVCPMTCLLPYWRWSGSERNIIAPWGRHCFAETCRSHRNKKIKEYIIQCILLVNLYVIDHALYKNIKDENIGIVDILRKIWMFVMKTHALSCGGYQTDLRSGNACDSYGEGAQFELSITGFRDFLSVHSGN